MSMFYKLLVVAVTLSAFGCVQLSGVPQTEKMEALQQQAQAGDMDSQYLLGLQYTVNGDGYSDHNRGYGWFLAAAEQGHLNAQYMVGMGKMFGRGTDVDREGAVKFFSLAAERGHARAQYQVGDAYINGNGVDKDQPWGRQWLEQAAWNGHRYAQFLLAALFSAGIGGEANMSEAWVWARKASQNDLERADKALQQLEEKMSQKELADGKSLLTRKPALEGNLYRIPRIRYVQTVLNQRGHNVGAEDGILGSQTRSAIAEFLVKNNLPQDTTMAALIEYLRTDNKQI